MKFRCECGHIVIDQSDEDYHHKGFILRQQSFNQAWDKPSEQVADFIRAIGEHRRQEWIESFYGKSFEIEDSAVIFDIFDQAQVNVRLNVYQCDDCGRIFIEHEPRSFTYRSFKPEDQHWPGTLADKHKNI